MNTNSNSYTIIYASVLVIIVAFLLAFVNSSLRELQGKNVELDSWIRRNRFFLHWAFAMCRIPKPSLPRW